MLCYIKLKESDPHIIMRNGTHMKQKIVELKSEKFNSE